MTIAAEDDAPRVKGRSSLMRSPQFSSFVILIILLAVFAVADANFLSPLNISNMMAFLPELGIIALGMTLLLTAGEFDLSVGAVFGLAPVVVMLLVQNGEAGIGVALLAASSEVSPMAANGRGAARAAGFHDLTTFLPGVDFPQRITQSPRRCDQNDRGNSSTCSAMKLRMRLVEIGAT